MEAITNFKRYDWQTWMVGIMRSFVSGGAGAFSGVAVPMVTDPGMFNVHAPGKLVEGMVFGFLLSGVVHLMMFLQTHGAPEERNGKGKEN